MKSTGIIRKIDHLGRFVVPIELRRNLGIEVNDPIEIFLEEDKVILKKHVSNNACIVTGEVSDSNIKLLDGKLTLSLEAAKDLLIKINKELELK